MRLRLALAGLLLVAAAQAKEPKRYQTGELLQMDSVQCGYDEKGAKSFAAISTRRPKNCSARSTCCNRTG